MTSVYDTLPCDVEPGEIKFTPLEQAMKRHTDIRPCVVEDAPDAHNVFLTIGNQQFTIGPFASDTREEAEWMQAMLCKALARIVADTAGIPQGLQDSGRPSRQGEGA